MEIEILRHYKSNYKILIIDDNHKDIDSLVSILHNLESKLEVTFDITTSDDINSMLNYCSNYSLIFLDIILEQNSVTNGINYSEYITSLNPQTHIVYITNYKNLLFDSYFGKAFGYLEKPFTQPKVTDMLNRLFSTQKNGNFYIKPGKRSDIIINSNKLIYIEAYDHKVDVFFLDDKQIMQSKTFYSSLKTWKEILLLSYYISVGNKYIVNLRYIEKMDKQYIYLYNNQKINIPRGLFDEINIAWQEYIALGSII